MIGNTIDLRCVVNKFPSVKKLCNQNTWRNYSANTTTRSAAYFLFFSVAFEFLFVLRCEDTCCLGVIFRCCVFYAPAITILESFNVSLIRVAFMAIHWTKEIPLDVVNDSLHINSSTNITPNKLLHICVEFINAQCTIIFLV